MLHSVLFVSAVAALPLAWGAYVPGQILPPAQETAKEWFLGFEVGERVPFDPDRVQTYRLVQGASVVSFDGKSTLHDFTGSTKHLVGSIRCRMNRLDTDCSARIAIDASTLDTQDVDRDQEMHEKHLESKTFPRIEFELSKCRDISWDRQFRRGLARLQGTLQIHGRKKDVVIPAIMALDGAILHVEGELKLLMSDYGITPPSKLGLIRVRDEVRVFFNIWAKRDGNGGAP